MSDRDELREKIASVAREFTHGRHPDEFSDRILALLPPQPKLEWRDDGLYLGGLLVGEVDRNGGEHYGFIYHDLLAIYDTEQEARAAIEKAVKEALGWND